MIQVGIRGPLYGPEDFAFHDERGIEVLEDGAELRTRSLSEVTWSPEEAPTAAEWDRAHAATGPREPVGQSPPGMQVGDLSRAQRQLGSP